MHLQTPAQRVGLTPLQSLLLRKWRPQWICQARRSQQRPWLTAPRGLATTTNKQTPDEKPYYVTTPIFYVNAAPHVGHMYNMILADVLKRWQQVKGRRAILCTGTDEHGLKVQQAAAKAQLEPKVLCDTNAETFKKLAAENEVSNDIFIRTTDQKHREAVEYAWQILQERGYIYESKHEGWYSVSDETFYPQSQVHLIVDPPTGRKIMVSIETGKEVEWTSELNYRFRLSAFRRQLLQWYSDNPEWIVPASRMEDVVQQVTENLEDLSVSRPLSRLTWGIPVPKDQSQTIYVWLDALLNYASAVGYPFTPGRMSADGWPTDVHVIGKDIVRFHCIYWPAFLMALDLPLPRKVLTHAHWTLGRKKMAKSTGNVVNPFFALNRFGVECMRWYLIQEGGIVDDADYDNDYVAQKYKKGLQGGLGNLAGRITRGRGWSVSRAVKRFAHEAHAGQAADSREWLLMDSVDEIPTKLFYGQLLSTAEETERWMQQLLPNKALQSIMKLVYNTNAYLQQTSPWTLAKKVGEVDGVGNDDIEGRMDCIIYLSAESLRLSGIMLQAFIPSSAKKLLDSLGVKEERRSFKWAEVGTDDDYGMPLNGSEKEILFPPLISDS